MNGGGGGGRFEDADATEARLDGSGERPGIRDRSSFVSSRTLAGANCAAAVDCNLAVQAGLDLEI